MITIGQTKINFDFDSSGNLNKKEYSKNYVKISPENAHESNNF